jgi:hypothetical protein
MASEQVPVASKRVPVASECVPVRTQRGRTRSKVTLLAQEAMAYKGQNGYIPRGNENPARPVGPPFRVQLPLRAKVASLRIRTDALQVKLHTIQVKEKS